MNRVDLLNIAEQFSMHLDVTDKGLRWLHDLSNDELKILAICPLRLQQLHDREYFLLLPLEYASELPSGPIPAPMLLYDDSRERLSISFLHLHHSCL